MKEEPDYIIELIKLVKRNSKTFLLSLVSCISVAGAYCLLKTPKYESVSLVAPINFESIDPLSNERIFSRNTVFAGKEYVNRLIKMAESNAASETYVRKNDLVARYDIASDAEGVKKLHKIHEWVEENTKFGSEDALLLKIKVYDKDPATAQILNQSYLDIIDSLNRNLIINKNKLLNYYTNQNLSTGIGFIDSLSKRLIPTVNSSASPSNFSTLMIFQNPSVDTEIAKPRWILIMIGSVIGGFLLGCFIVFMKNLLPQI